jgi:hypothetical protein
MMLTHGVQAAATLPGASVSHWLADAARSRLRIDNGLAPVAEWEAERGQLSDEEMTAATARSLSYARASPARRTEAAGDLMAALEASVAAAREKNVQRPPARTAAAKPRTRARQAL